MKAPFMSILLASMASPLKGSCPENTAAVICHGAAFVPQVYCNDADPEKWPCKRQRNIRCGCVAGYARARNGECVRVTECDIRNDVRLIYPYASNTQSEGNQNGKDVQGTNRELTGLGETVLELLKSTEHIYVTKISTHIERNDECVCLKSSFLVNGVDGVERTLECYYYVPSRAGHGSKAKVLETTRLISRKQYAEFKVSTNGSKTVINVDPAELPSEVTHLNERELYLTGEFIVLQADLQCLVVELGKESDGRSICLLWTSASSVNNEQSKCLNDLQQLCQMPMKDVTNNINKCNEHDASEQGADEKANQGFLDRTSSQK
ncbi:uncharacterized protein LOC125945648 [Dermacentor silvarum]|uniref:uncharacterized protein LOC125945648 n=1 Tax=Dermacentor silvarum TaxID=543639 RepID=UPI002100FD09|nr:uncharacterized protein LOC125945648 [Dermacentor silvarum]